MRGSARLKHHSMADERRGRTRLECPGPEVDECGTGRRRHRCGGGRWWGLFSAEERLVSIVTAATLVTFLLVHLMLAVWALQDTQRIRAMMEKWTNETSGDS